MRRLLTTLCLFGTAALTACADAGAPTAPTGAMAPSGPARTVVNFGFTQIGTPGTAASAVAMNDAGQVAVTTRPVSLDLAALWVNGSMQLLLGGPGSVSTTPADINALGTVVGMDRAAFGTPAVWENGVYTALPLYPGGGGATASAINDLGRIVGNDGQGLFWADKSVAAPLRLQSYTGLTFTYDINNAGMIVGESSVIGSSAVTPRAVIWTSETAALQPLAGFASGTLCEGDNARASAINEMGEIVGQCPSTGGAVHAAYWANKDALAVDLDLLAGFSIAKGINELGQIVGTAGDLTPHATLWSREAGTFRSFDLGVPSGSPSSNGIALNNTGQAVLVNGDQVAVDQSFLVSIPMRAAIDLDPSSTANAIKLGKGTVTVAILGSRWFRATDVDPASLTLGNDDGLDTPVAMKKGAPSAKLTDVNRDGFLDLVADFDEGALMNNGDLVVGTQTLVLLGRTKTGAHVRGTDVAIASK